MPSTSDTKMKIFTVGMNEKLPIKENSIQPDTAIALTSTPVIAIEKKRTSFKNFVMFLGALFFIISTVFIVSKLVHYRISDDFGLPWSEMKHRIGMGCDYCMNARIIKTFYPERVSENSNNAVPIAPAITSQAGQSETSDRVADDKSVSQRLELASPNDLLQTAFSRIDFLRKIIPKIKEQAEKSGIEGVMQVKLLEMDSSERKQLFDGSDQSQFQPAIPFPKPTDFLTSSRLALLPDFLHWNMADNDESQMPANQFFGSQQDAKIKDGPMLVMGPFLRTQLLPSAWGIDNNIVWNSPPQIRPLDIGQQISKQQQQWVNQWQYPGFTYNRNNNEKFTEWQNIQWSNSHLPTSAMQQNPSSIWQTDNRWQDNNNFPIANNWQNGIQNGAGNHHWAQNGWQGQGQQQQQQQFTTTPYPQTWQESVNSNDWNIQKANTVDNFDERMTQAILPSNNVNNIDNNNANDYWTRYWRNMKEQLQQRSLVNTADGQSPEMMEPIAQQTQDQSLEQQQHLVQPQPPINILPNQVFHQNPSGSVVFSGSDDTVPRTVAPFVFSSESWKMTKNPSILIIPPDAKNQEQQQLPNQEQQQQLSDQEQKQQLPIHPIENDLGVSKIDLKLTNDDFNKDTIMEQSTSISDINDGLSDPVFFQVDDPPQQSDHVDESLIK